VVLDIVMVMSDVPNGKALAKCFLVDASFKSKFGFLRVD
jgi:hypothetical protein